MRLNSGWEAGLTTARFLKKYRKWYGADQETAQQKWDEHVADRTVDRYYQDGVLFLAAPSTGTAHSTTGSRVGNERALADSQKMNVGDTEAVRDVRNRYWAELCLPDSIFLLFTVMLM